MPRFADLTVHIIYSTSCLNIDSAREDAVYVDVREFYGEAGLEKPSKKGISLSPEQVRASILVI